MDVTIIFILVLALIGVVIAVKQTYRRKEQTTTSTEEPPLPHKSIQLLTENGETLLEYEDVYLTHWDTNIYFLSYEYKGPRIMRIDKGENMLLLIEEYKDV